ncbi:MAG: hypothetical protein RL266_1455 [Bacteroidota bacterium]|jgi:uncharacterized membrane protein YedE/YeeE
MDFLLGAWPWYVAGPLIGLFVPVMVWLGSAFGVSGNLESICSLAGAHRISDYFDNNISKRLPGLLFVFGAGIGGYVATHHLGTADYSVDLSDSARSSISQLGITDLHGLQPQQLFNWEFLLSWQGFIMLGLGGFLIGFGTRYAGGCTSGHSISGMSALQPNSLVATIGFFIGGLLSTHFLIPLLLTP